VTGETAEEPLPRREALTERRVDRVFEASRANDPCSVEQSPLDSRDANRAMLSFVDEAELARLVKNEAVGFALLSLGHDHFDPRPLETLDSPQPGRGSVTEESVGGPDRGSRQPEPGHRGGT